MTMIFFAVNLSAESARSYVLAEGAVIRAGVPGFGPNAIPGLLGKYSAEGGDAFAEIRAVRDPLLFNRSLWTETRVGDFRALYNGTERGVKVWAVSRDLAVREKSGIPARWVFVVSFSGDVPDALCRDFVEAVVRRTESFFVSARHLSDLSFPATVRIAGKK